MQLLSIILPRSSVRLGFLKSHHSLETVGGFPNREQFSPGSWKFIQNSQIEIIDDFFFVQFLCVCVFFLFLPKNNNNRFWCIAVADYDDDDDDSASPCSVD